MKPSGVAPPTATPADADQAEQARPGYGVPTQDPRPGAQVPLPPEEAEREAQSALAGGGAMAGAAAGAIVGVATAGPVGVVVGGTVGVVAGALAGAAASAKVKPAASGEEVEADRAVASDKSAAPPTPTHGGHRAD